LAHQTGAQDHKGTLRATFVMAYRGYVADGRAYLRAALEEPVIPPPAEATDTSALKSNLRRFVALSFPGVKVTSLAGRSELAESGRTCHSPVERR
jgi:hypothetical protein